MASGLLECATGFAGLEHEFTVPEGTREALQLCMARTAAMFEYTHTGGLGLAGFDAGTKIVRLQPCGLSEVEVVVEDNVVASGEPLLDTKTWCLKVGRYKINSMPPAKRDALRLWLTSRDREVSFTDREGMRSTIRLRACALSWHIGTKCHATRIRVLEFRAQDSTILAPEVPELVVPIARMDDGADLRKLLAQLTAMAAAAQVKTSGFDTPPPCEYLSLTLMAARDATAERMTLSQVRFMHDGRELACPAEGVYAGAVSDEPSTKADEVKNGAPGCLVDGKMETHWVSVTAAGGGGAGGRKVIFRLEEAVTPDSYSWTTAPEVEGAAEGDDPARQDPVKWQLHGSVDGKSWRMLDDRSKESQAKDVPTDRGAPMGPVEITEGADKDGKEAAGGGADGALAKLEAQTVAIRGATGPNAELLNGVYEPTGRLHGGRELYKKQPGPC